MTKEELAAQLNGTKYPAERNIPLNLIQIAKQAGLIIVFGASDDLMEFDGAQREEISCNDGGTAYVDAQGVLPDRDTLEEDDEIAEYVQRKAQAIPIQALWCAEDGYSWTYRTDIPHAAFDVLEDGEPYCRGLVFALADCAARSASA